MARKTMQLITLLVVLSLTLAPIMPAQAAPAAQTEPPYCPDIDPHLATLPDFAATLPAECLEKYSSQLQPEGEEAAPPDSEPAYWPDPFGYQVDQWAPFNWISATEDTGLTGDDEASGLVDIGFPFKFYGILYNQLYFSTNGIISFSEPIIGPVPSAFPIMNTPTNFIAAFSKDLRVGVSGNTGAIYYSRGGTAPDRYFVLEWRNVAYTDYYFTTPVNYVVSFEAILYENGNISVQLGPTEPDNPESPPADIGIRDKWAKYGDKIGPYYGLVYENVNILFSYPTVLRARVELEILDQHPIITAGEVVDFRYILYNPGSKGTDTYDFTMENLGWSYSLLWDAPGNPPLTDTDADGKIDTGPVPEGGSVQFIVRVTVPDTIAENTQHGGSLKASSSVQITINEKEGFTMRALAPFVSVFGEATDGSIRFRINTPQAIIETKPGPDGTFGYYPAVTELPSGNYFYAWEIYRPVGSIPVTTLQFSIVGHDGTVLKPAAPLVNTPTKAYAYLDETPSVAAAPDGTIGMVWRRVVIDRTNGKRNTNLYLARFNSTGQLLGAPVNITNDPYWGGSEFDAYGIYTSPSIAATSTNRFVIAWQDWYGNSYVLYAIRSTSGALVRDLTLMPPVFTPGAESPVLNSLNGGRVIFTWNCGPEGPCYSVVNDVGNLVKAPASLIRVGNTTTGNMGWYADAVQLPNGNVAVPWSTGGMYYATLGPTYSRIGEYSQGSVYNGLREDRISAALDDHGHMIMSMAGTGYDANNRYLHYALATPGNYAFDVDPIVYRMSETFHLPNMNGQGIAPYRSTIPLPGAIKKTGPANGAASVDLAPVLSWSSTPLAGYYEYCYDTIDDGVCNTSWSEPVLQTSAQLPKLKYQTTYYWQVRAVNPSGVTYADFSEGATWSFTTTNLIYPGWYGSVSVTSDRPLVSVARPHVGAEVASYDGVTGGGLTAYVPMLFKNAFGGSYDSAFYVQNVDTSTADINIKFYDSAGVETCSVDDTLAPLASKGWWLPALPGACLPDGWVGGAVVTANKNITATGRPHVGAEVMTYNGFSSGTLTSYLPMLFKDGFGGTYDSAFYVQNVGAADASITIKFYDSAGVQSCELTDTLAPFASKGWWLPGLPNDCLPSGWVGSAVVTSDQPVVTIARPHVGSQVTSYSGLSGGGASMYVPMLFKDAFGGSYDSAFYVQNVDAVDADIAIKFYDSAGNLSCELTDTIAPLASSGWWVPGLADDCLPPGWVGGAVVTSAQNIVAVGRPHVGAQVTTYPGIPSGSPDVFLPMLFRDAFGGSYDSAFYLQNTDTLAADVTLKFFDADGVLACQRTDTIPALATLGYWLPSVTCEP